MGLNMYLYKTKKVAGFSAVDYINAEKVLDYKQAKAYAKKLGGNFTDTLKDWGVPESMTLKKAEILESEYKNVGTYVEWFSIFDKVGYWCEVDHIHDLFVNKVQGGTDDCSYYFVSKDHFLELKETCEKVLALYEEMETRLEELMPTQSGFFSGETDSSTYYFQTVKDTLKIVDEILESGNFDKEVYLYHSSYGKQ